MLQRETWTVRCPLRASASISDNSLRFAISDCFYRLEGMGVWSLTRSLARCECALTGFRPMAGATIAAVPPWSRFQHLNRSRNRKSPSRGSRFPMESTARKRHHAAMRFPPPLIPLRGRFARARYRRVRQLPARAPIARTDTLALALGVGTTARAMASRRYSDRSPNPLKLRRPLFPLVRVEVSLAPSPAHAIMALCRPCTCCGLRALCPLASSARLRAPKVAIA